MSKQTTTTRNEYQIAFRAMRKWWKLVDSRTFSPSNEDRIYRSICGSYGANELQAAMDSIRARRNAEYMTEHPEVAKLKAR